MALPSWARRPFGRETGHVMAVLLVSLGVMAVLLTAAAPVWRQAAQREKEEELIFRGQQYARAIGLYQRKYPGAFPPSLDVLVDQRFLRRRYRDPMVEDGEFQLLYQNAAAQQAPGGGQSSQSSLPATGGRAGESASRPSAGARGGVIGVASKSKESSIRVYKGRTHYNEWQFVYTPVTQQPGAAPGQTGQPGAPSTGTRPGRQTSPPEIRQELRQRGTGRVVPPRPPGGPR